TGGGQSSAQDIAGHKFEVHETVRICVLSGMVEKHSICIETYHSSSRADSHAKKIRYAARTTAQIETAPSRRHTDAVQHNRCVTNQRVTLSKQSFNFARSSLQRITMLLCFRHSQSPCDEPIATD